MQGRLRAPPSGRDTTMEILERWGLSPAPDGLHYSQAAGTPQGLCLEELSLLPGKDLPVPPRWAQLLGAGEARPRLGAGARELKAGAQDGLAGGTGSISNCHSATKHCRHTARPTARALGFGSCPWQGIWRCLRGQRHRLPAVADGGVRRVGSTGTTMLRVLSKGAALVGRRLRTAGDAGQMAATGPSLVHTQEPLPWTTATHLASPQIRVTVPSSKSSTVTATSSELV